jgi:hypothetical protein
MFWNIISKNDRAITKAISRRLLTLATWVQTHVTLCGIYGREADHSHPTSVEVKKTWDYTSAPPYAFMAYCLIS